MSTRRVRCPSCLTEVPTSGGKAASRCPGCGAKIASNAADPQPAQPPRRRKVRRKPRKEYHFDWIGPVMSFGAAVGLLVVSLGVAGVVGLVTGAANGLASGPNTVPNPNPYPVIAPPTTPNPSEPVGPLPKEPGAATPFKPDPAPPTAKPFTFASKVGLPLYGNPILSDGPFALDTPVSGLNINPALHEKEDRRVPVIDLRNGQSFGRLAKTTPRNQQAVLSAKGEMLATRPALLGGGGPLVEVWMVDVTEPLARFMVKGEVLWMDFLGEYEMAMHVRDVNGEKLQVWKFDKSEMVREMPLPKEWFPIPPGTDGNNYSVNRGRGALSPGGKQVALGGPKGIAIINLSDGHVLSKLPIDPDDGRILYEGLRFSRDGMEITSLYVVDRQAKGQPSYLKTWKIADGQSKVEVSLPRKNWTGLLIGPEPGMALVSWFDPQDGKVFHKCQMFEGDQPGREVPYQPVSWLADGRLLVVGPIKEAPPETPLPELLDKPDRNDPAVRAIYPVTFNP